VRYVFPHVHNFFNFPIHPRTRLFVHCFQAAHAKAEKKLQEERATLTRFDNELKELERVIKEKKQAVSDADLQLKKYEHDMQALTKEKTAAVNFVANLEKQYDWIPDESAYVPAPYSVFCVLIVLKAIWKEGDAV
jgi:septal ring factor EnvC (AmiA/AmiB activator)